MGRLAARLPHTRPRPGGRDPTSPRARHRAPPSGSGVPALLPTLEEPTPIATHARQGLPSPEPSPSPHGESLTTSVIKRTRIVNTCSGIHGLRPLCTATGRSTARRIGQHGTSGARPLCFRAPPEGPDATCGSQGAGRAPRRSRRCHRPAPPTGRGRSTTKADPARRTPTPQGRDPLTPEGARPAQTTSNARSS